MKPPGSEAGRKDRPGNDSSNYLPTLDGWRAIAICLVLFGHASVGLGVGDFKEVGSFGVELFFGLSGFLITTLLLREEERSGYISLVGFYVRRIFRIFPAAIFFLVIAGLLSLMRIIDVTAERWISTLFFMANYSRAQGSWYVGHFWSLAVEEHFYLIWPLTLVLVRQNQKRLAIAASVAFGVALWRAVDFKLQLTWTDIQWFLGRTDIQADAIAFGVCFALVLRIPATAPRITQYLQHPLTGPSAIGVFVLIFFVSPYLNWKCAFALLTVRAAIVPVMILSTMMNPNCLLSRTLEDVPFRFVGRISYSLYLWQQLFLVWERNAKFGVLQSFPINLCAAFICAGWSYYLIERPLIHVGHRLARST